MLLCSSGESVLGMVKCYAAVYIPNFIDKSLMSSLELRIQLTLALVSTFPVSRS